MASIWDPLWRDKTLLVATLKQVQTNSRKWAQKKLNDRPIAALGLAAFVGFMLARRLPLQLSRTLTLLAGSAAFDKMCEQLFVTALTPPPTDPAAPDDLSE